MRAHNILSAIPTALVIAVAGGVLANCSPKPKAADPAATPAAEAKSAAAVEDMGSDQVNLPQIVCGPNGFIKPSDTRESLASAHGAENLREETVAWVDSEETALVLFPDSPDMRMEMFWFGRTSGGPTQVRVDQKDTQAIGPYGLIMGATLEDVEKANGGPFELIAFQNHNQGEVTNWLGGKLDTPENADCHVGMSFGLPETASGDAAGAVSGDSEKRFRSDSPEMRAAAPVVSEFGLTFVSQK